MSRKAVTVLMLGPGLDVKGGISSVQRLILKFCPQDLNIRHISTFEEGNLAKKALVFLRSIVQVLRIIRTEQVDLVYLHMAQRGSTLRKAILVVITKATGTPVIVHAHGSEFEKFFRNLPGLLRQLVSMVFRQCDLFIALSESWATFYIENLRLAPDKVAVLYNPVEVPATVPRRQTEGETLFVFLGRIGQRKGAFDLIRAFANLPRELQERARLVLAGDGEVARAKSMVRELHLDGRVNILSWIGPSERADLLASASVLVLPSYNEGLPMAILEAMASGLPVITTPVGGIPEIVKHEETGLLVTPGDIPALTAAMATMIYNASQRQLMGLRARSAVQRFNIRSYMTSLEELMQHVIRSHFAGRAR